jgi:hypothetical protein
VAWPGTGQRTVVLHTHEQDAAGSVRQTHDGFDEFTIVQRAATLPFELDVIALSVAIHARTRRTDVSASSGAVILDSSSPVYAQV